jgi:diguanylate cyclase (GGDEF)-like protein
LLRAGVLGLQCGASLWLLDRRPEQLAGWLERASPTPDWLGLPAPVALLLALAAVTAGARLATRHGAPLDAALLAAALLVGGVLRAPGAGPRVELALAATALALLVGVVEDAHGKAYMDQLTGLPGRRALDEWMRHPARRYSLAMVDVDHFKRLNDRNGHAVGDQVLRMLAAQLSRVEAGGRAYRYGGEEFVLVFRGHRSPQLLAALERLRKRVAERPFRVRSPQRPGRRTRSARGRGGGSGLKVSVSIGVADNRQAGSADAVLKAADKALYRAKRAGRNRVVH